jgi:REP element-mobilizing transposase RayT
MVRGIERRKIFGSDSDRDHFVSRLGKVLKETETICYAWALLPNHFHLLLGTGPVPLSTLMRRLLTGYAVWYNRSHRRQGHLFQNRFKSVLCQEDAYLLELVRYIHLNPIRAGIVDNLEELGHYPYSGHSALTGKVEREWQETATVLGLFGEKRRSARGAYEAFVGKGIGEGRRPDLTGGGLIRSAGGWEKVKALREEKAYQRSDERILGDGAFVGKVLAAAEEAMESRYRLRARGYDLEKVASRVSEVLGTEPGVVCRKGRYRDAVEARSLFCYWAVRELGTPMSVLSTKLGISLPAASKSVLRGQAIAETKGISLLSS